MAQYDRMRVVEIIITAGMTMTALRDTLNGRVNQTGWQETSRTLLQERTSASNTVHVWAKHGAIRTCIKNLHVRNKVNQDSTRVYKTNTCEYNGIKVDTCRRNFDNSLLGCVTVQSNFSSGLEVRSSKSCHVYALVKRKEKQEYSKKYKWHVSKG